MRRPIAIMVAPDCIPLTITLPLLRRQIPDAQRRQDIIDRPLGTGLLELGRGGCGDQVLE